MSCSRDSSETAGGKSAKMPEKPNFAQTCSLLSQYLKEKGSFGDLSLGMSSNLEEKPETYHQTVARMNWLRNMEIPGEVSGVSAGNPTPSRNLKSMDLFPQHAGFGPSVSTGDVPKAADFSPNKPAAMEPEASSQMTIFYGGRVLVFNDFPADKAKEVMLLASKASSINTGSAQTSSNSLTAPAPSFISSCTNLTQELLQRSSQPIGSDLPIARKASLHRFLEKRKDRINSSAPYPSTSGSKSAVTSSKPAQSKASWLDLAPQCSKPLELQLL